MRLTAFVTCAFLMLFPLPASAGEAIMMPGTSWSIEPPAGFSLTRDPIAMFLHPTKAVLMIAQTPISPLKLSDLGSIGSIQGEGNNVARLEETRELTVGGRHALLFKAYMTVRNAKMISMLIEGENSNAMVVAVVPAAAEGQVDMAAVEAAMLTTVEQKQTIEQRADALPYRLDDLAGMRISDIQVGAVAVVTDGPSSDIGKAIDQPFATIFVSDADGQGSLDAERNGEVVRQRILQEYPGADFLGTTMRDTSKGRVLEITYTRAHKDSGKTLGGVAWLRVDGSKGVLMIAQYPLKGGYYDRLASIRDGVSVK